MYDLIFYLELGLVHVLDWNAIDHMLFLCALTIVYTFKDFKTVFWIVTFFTFGHTFSLILSAFDLFKPPSQLIEFLIPTTIIVTSLYNILDNKNSKNNLFEYTFSVFFGLIHGFGFGNYFEMLTDSIDAKITPLIGFAIGVELSQLVVVLGILIINTILHKLNLISRTIYIKVVSVTIILLSLNLIYQMI
ncbi:HupE/UreJ family protein [bacterium]|nr:HupE/UreJ family protein [bacterium]